VVSAEIFEKSFAGVIDTRRRVIDLRADLTRDHVGKHNAAMMMRLRCSTWIVVDLHGRQRFSRDVGKLFREYLANFFAAPRKRAVGGKPDARVVTDSATEPATQKLPPKPGRPIAMSDPQTL
jgi:hypothetical protein